MVYKTIHKAVASVIPNDFGYFYDKKHT